jgi:hypothetical protein
MQEMPITELEQVSGAGGFRTGSDAAVSVIDGADPIPCGGIRVGSGGGTNIASPILF